MDSQKLPDQTGSVIQISDTLIVIGINGAHNSRTVNEKTAVTIKEKKAGIGDIKAGEVVTLAGDPVTSIVVK